MIVIADGYWLGLCRELYDNCICFVFLNYYSKATRFRCIFGMIMSGSSMFF